MKIAVFSAKRHDREFLGAANIAAGHELQYFEAALGAESATVAAGHDAVSFSSMTSPTPASSMCSGAEARNWSLCDAPGSTTSI